MATKGGKRFRRRSRHTTPHPAGTGPAKVVTMSALQAFQERVRACQNAIDGYAALRPAIFAELALVPKGWIVRFSRDPARGDPDLPVRWTQHVVTNFKIGNLPIEAGIATVHQPETYAPFSDFQILNPDGERLPADSEIGHVEMRLPLLLERMLEVMKVLAGTLRQIEHDAAALRLSTDTTSLSRLDLHLPSFPYWPYDRKREERDQLIADEKPLLDAARLTLRRLSVEANAQHSLPPLGAEGAKRLFQN